MAMSKESQICSLLRQLLRNYEEKIEMQAINRIQELLEVISLDTLSEKIELISLIYETSQKQGCDRLRLFCTQKLFMQGEKTGLKALSSVAKFLCNPLETTGIKEVMSGLLKVCNNLDFKVFWGGNNNVFSPFYFSDWY